MSKRGLASHAFHMNPLFTYAILHGTAGTAPQLETTARNRPASSRVNALLTCMVVRIKWIPFQKIKNKEIFKS
jgi:hypothetical protein